MNEHFWKKQLTKAVEKPSSPRQIDQTYEILPFLAFGF